MALIGRALCRTRVVMAFVSRGNRIKADSWKLSPIFTCHTGLPVTGSPAAAKPPQRNDAKLGCCFALLSLSEISYKAQIFSASSARITTNCITALNIVVVWPSQVLVRAVSTWPGNNRDSA